MRRHAKRKRAWVFTAIHGDRTRGTGILNKPLYVGQVRWTRSTWKRSAADSMHRRWQLNDSAQVLAHQDERLRFVPQALWDAVNARQQAVESMAVNIRGALKGSGRVPRPRDRHPCLRYEMATIQSERTVSKLVAGRDLLIP